MEWVKLYYAGIEKINNTRPEIRVIGGMIYERTVSGIYKKY
jgi:hypothetical protein